MNVIIKYLFFSILLLSINSTHGSTSTIEELPDDDDPSAETIKPRRSKYLRVGPETGKLETPSPGYNSSRTPSPVQLPDKINEEIINTDKLKRVGEVSYIQNGMLIILDDTEEAIVPGGVPLGQYLRPMTNRVFLALEQEACPMIVSRHLLENIYTICRYVIAYLNKNYPKTAKAISQRMPILCLLKQWQFFEISSNLCLCIPNNYQAARTIGQSAEKDTDYLLGLKISRLKEISLFASSTTVVSKPTKTSQQSFIDALTSDTIFCTKKDYSLVMENKFDQPQWTIYLAGHGEYKKNIANFSIADFRLLLDTFDKKLNTSLFFYQSCFSGGVNTQSLYEAPLLQKSYSFPIMQTALTDATAHTAVIYFENITDAIKHGISRDEKDQKIVISHMFEDNEFGTKQMDYFEEVSFANFKKFIDLATSTNLEKSLTGYDVLADCLLSPYYRTMVNNGVQIKMPGTEWFSVLNLQSFTPIGKVLSQTKSTPLKIKSNNGNILLYHDIIPFTIDFSDFDFKTKTPKLISMIPGNAFHYIHAIKVNTDLATSTVNKNILNLFESLQCLAPEKQFFIKNIFDENGDLIMEDVLIYKPEGDDNHFTISSAKINGSRQLLPITTMHRDSESLDKASSNSVEIIDTEQLIQKHGKLLPQSYTEEDLKYLSKIVGKKAKHAQHLVDDRREKRSQRIARKKQISYQPAVTAKSKKNKRSKNQVWKKIK